MTFDTTIFNQLYDLVGRSVCFDSIVIFLAQNFIWLLIILFFLIYLFYRQNLKSSRIFFLSAGSFILSYIFFILIQYLYFRPRPFVTLNIVPLIDVSVKNASFPSFHTLLAFVLALTTSSINKKLGAIFIIGACLIGLARIFAGVHWPSDVLVGALIAILSFYLVRKFLKNINL